MQTQTGKPQMTQNASVLTAGGGDGAWSAEIGDGDFRTYVLLCQAAWQEQPRSETPYTERNFADLARLHPARQRPTAETVRGRLYRLSKAGLIRRERSGRTTWRTYPILDGLRLPEPETYSGMRKQGESLAASKLVTSGSAQVVTARQEHTQEVLATSSLAASDSAQDVTARQARAQDASLATSNLAASHQSTSRFTPPVFRSLALSHRDGLQPRPIVRRSVEMPESPDAERPKQEARVYSLSDLAHILPANLRPVPMDGSVGARPEHTQEELATSNLAASDAPQAVTARRERAQEQSESTNAVTARQEHTQDEQLAASSPATSTSSQDLTARGARAQEQIESTNAVTARPEHTQDEPLAASSLATSTSARAVTARRERAQEQSKSTNAVTARPEHTQDEPLATSTSVQAVAARGARAQKPDSAKDEPVKSVTARQEHTQEELATSNLAASDSPQVVTAQPEPTQDEPLAASSLAPGSSASPSRTRTRASVLSGTDLPPSEITPKLGRSTAPDSTGDTNARAKGPRPPVLERVQVPEGYEDLAVQLANLRPQGMNFEGIAECMKNPELTRAWTEHALSTKEVIRNVPAYIRAGVRSGKLPVTDAEKEALQAERKPNPAARAAIDYGWDDPALKDWDVSDIFRKPGPSKGRDKYGWGDPDETTPDPYGGPYVH